MIKWIVISALLISVLLPPQKGWAQFDPPRISFVFNKPSQDSESTSLAAGRTYMIDKGRDANIVSGDGLNVYRERRLPGPAGPVLRIFVGTLKITISQKSVAIGEFTPDIKTLEQLVTEYKPAMGGDVVLPRLIIDSGVLFDPGKFGLRQGAALEFKKVADFVNLFSPSKLVIEGHTDGDGDDDANQRLSAKRAIAVKQSLVDQYGIQAAMIEAMGYGEKRPLVNNDTPENKALNRRIEVIVWE